MTPEKRYQEAEKLIAEAQKSGSRVVDLFNLQLTKVPPQIAQLSQLQELDLSDNKIVEIPDGIVQPDPQKILTEKIEVHLSSVC